MRPDVFDALLGNIAKYAISPILFALANEKISKQEFDVFARNLFDNRDYILEICSQVFRLEISKDDGQRLIMEVIKNGQAN